jgi:hypothetical protein
MPSDHRLTELRRAYVAGRKQYRVEDQQRHCPLGIFRGLGRVHAPESTFVEEGQQWMGMLKILLHKLVQDMSNGDEETTLRFKEVDVLRGYRIEIVDG